MKIKFTLTSWIMFASIHWMFSQTADITLTGTGGGMETNGSVFLSYSFGEPFTTYTQNDNWITEGFQQPEKIDLTTSISILNGKYALRIFPNPATSVINAEWNDLITCNDIQIQNILGQTIHKDRIDSKESILISLDHLESGIYWLSIQCGTMPSITKPFIKL